MLFTTKVLLAAGLAAQLIQASPVKVRSPFVVKDTHRVPAVWTELGPAPEDHVVELRIAVKQGDFKELEKHHNY